ncbi:MAG: hypothetical protein MN733_40440 [Nitrososphaera sp.]|nr:hypothetical protein [Nitrososphaera sp.]
MYHKLCLFGIFVMTAASCAGVMSTRAARLKNALDITNSAVQALDQIIAQADSMSEFEDELDAVIVAKRTLILAETYLLEAYTGAEANNYEKVAKLLPCILDATDEAIAILEKHNKKFPATLKAILTTIRNGLGGETCGH